MKLTRRALMAFAPLAYRARAGATPAGDLLWDYFVRELSAADERRRRELASLGTAAELAALRTRVRTQLIDAIGGFPERTPLNTQETGALTRSDYVIEKIVFESRPRFYVSANVYRPKSTAVRCPVVIQSCGHYVEGKAAPTTSEPASVWLRRALSRLFSIPSARARAGCTRSCGEKAERVRHERARHRWSPVLPVG